MIMTIQPPTSVVSSNICDASPTAPTTMRMTARAIRSRAPVPAPWAMHDMTFHPPHTVPPHPPEFGAPTSPHGRVKITEIAHRGHSRSAGMRYLTRIVDRIGDRDRVVIVGPGRVRMRLDRAYVSLLRRPGHLVRGE